MRSSSAWRGWLRAALTVALLAAAIPGARAADRIIRIESDYLREPTTVTEGGVAVAVSSEREQVRDMAQEWRKRVQEGNASIAGELIPDMKRLLALPGYHDRGSLTGSFVAMGRDWSQLDDLARARQAYEAALELEPATAAAHLGLGALSWQRDGGITGAFGLLAGVVRAWAASVTTLIGVLRMVANLALVLVIAAAVTVGALAVVLMAKYNRLLRHGAREFLADRVPEGIDGVLGWVLVFLPVILFLSPPWWVAWWLVVFRQYGTRAEKRLSLVGLVLLLLTAPAFHVATRLAQLPHDPVVKAAHALRTRDVGPLVVVGAERTSSKLRSPEGRFLLARVYQAAGREDDAVALYDDIAERSAVHARAMINRGNVAFRNADTASAIGDYKRATDSDRRAALAWRNGSIAYAQDLKTDLAGDWLREAQRLAANDVQEWNSQVGQDSMVDADLTSGEVASLVLARQDGLASGLVGRLLSPPSLAALLGLLISLFAGQRVFGRFEAAACEKCGRAFCSRCHAAAKTSAYCTQCVHLYVKKDGVSPVVRSAKLREVTRWVAVNSLATRLFNILLPGAGSLYGNRVLAGTALVFSWAVAVTGLLLPAHLLMATDRIGQEDLTVLFGVELALLVAVYAVALVQSLRHGG